MHFKARLHKYLFWFKRDLNVYLFLFRKEDKDRHMFKPKAKIMLVQPGLRPSNRRAVYRVGKIIQNSQRNIIINVQTIQPDRKWHLL